MSTGAGTVVQRGLVIGDRTFASSDGPELKKILATIGVTLTTQQTRALDTALFLKDESLPDWLTAQKIDFDKARLVAACRPPAPTAPEVTGRVGVALAEIANAVSGKGGRIGDSHYSFKVEDDRITLEHATVRDVSCNVTFKITAGVLGVKHILSRPYEGNGLGLLLVAAMLKLAKARDARAATLSTDNQAMKFWANFGLRQDAEVPIDTAIGSLREPLHVTDPPVEKGG